MSRVVEAIGFLHNVGWGWRKRRERKGRGGTNTIVFSDSGATQRTGAGCARCLSVHFKYFNITL